MSPACGANCLLTINGGSSSLKVALFRIEDGLARIIVASVTGVGEPAGRTRGHSANGKTLWDQDVSCVDHPAALNVILREMACHIELEGVGAVGHRVVHGGPNYTRPLRLTASIEARLHALAPLAPLHMPANLDGIAAARRRFPKAVHYACFDTGFHASMPTVAQETGLPPGMRDDSIRRYGFHGLSYAFIVEDLEARLGAAAAQQRLLVAHLGAGASMAAIHYGQTVDTSMGFSALAGLPMATRSGDVDPGLLLYLILTKNWEPSELENQLYHSAGLLGLSGLSGNVQTLLAAEDNPHARRALEQFAYQARKQAGALVAAMGGVDRIIFTGGIGENAPAIRSAICQPLSDLFKFDFDANANAEGASLISKPGSAVVVETVRTDEAVMIARAGYAILEEGLTQKARCPS